LYQNYNYDSLIKKDNKLQKYWKQSLNTFAHLSADDVYEISITIQKQDDMQMENSMD